MSNVECKRKSADVCAKPEKVCVIKKTKGEFDMKDFVRPDQASKCTWHKGADSKTSPHSKIRIKHTNAVLPNILHTVGNTPMVKLNKIPQSMGIKCDMYVKCEFFNPGGSVKDRIGYRMVEDAERQGILKPGCTIIEPTSGNTGIGLALASAVKGYRCIIVMPEKMSNEKVDTLRALGAEIIRTPTAASFDSPEGLIAVSQKLQKEIPNSVVLDQYRNAGNPLAHYDTTAEEILEPFNGKVDMVVIGAGTGGTVCGIGRRLKEACPTCMVVAADPEGSVLALPEELNKTDVTFYEVEGIGYDFVPTVLDRDVVDVWIKANDKESLPLAKRLIRDEGLLCGGSSGLALACALKAAANLKEGQKCVVILPDGIRNYMTKFVSDQWMEARHFKPCTNMMNHWWWDMKVSQMNLAPPTALKCTVTCAEALQVLKEKCVAQLPVLDTNGSLMGMITSRILTQKLMNKFVEMSDSISKAVELKYYKVDQDCNLGLLSRILEIEQFVLITNGNGKKEQVRGIVTNVDFLHFVSQQNDKNGK